MRGGERGRAGGAREVDREWEEKESEEREREREREGDILLREEEEGLLMATVVLLHSV